MAKHTRMAAVLHSRVFKIMFVLGSKYQSQCSFSSFGIARDVEFYLDMK